MKCFYHGTDFDGRCSGAIVKYFHPGCELIPVSYDDEIDFDKIYDDETVFIVDFSFPPKVMEKLAVIANLIWIDHHKSAINSVMAHEYATKPIPFYARKTVIGEAGCELTWKYFQESENAGEMPRIVKLVGRYDVFDHSDPCTLPLQYGLRLSKDTVYQEFWNYLFTYNDSNALEKLIESGIIAYEYQRQQNKILCNIGFETIFEGYRCYCINGIGNSLIFDELENRKEYDILVLFHQKIKDGKVRYKFVLFNNDNDHIDVSKIAEKHGGGGHKGAAGFHTDLFVLK